MAKQKSIPQLKQHSNSKWYIHYRENGRGKRVSTGTEDVEEAQIVFAGWLKGEKEASDNSALRTMQSVWDEYWHQHVEKKVIDKKRLRISGNNLMEYFGKMPVMQVERSDSIEYLHMRTSGEIGRPVVESTVRRELNAMVAALNFNTWKVEPRNLRIDRREIPFLEMPAHGAPRTRVLTKDEIVAILKATDETTRLGLYLRILIATGARKTALLELKWDQVDFENDIIRFNPVGRMQTRKRRPTVPMNKKLRGILERTKERAEQACELTDYVLGTDEDIHWPVKALMQELGLEDVTSHVFRHTFATRSVQQGKPLEAVSMMLGDTLSTVVKNYQHLQPDYLHQFKDDGDLGVHEREIENV